MVTRLFSPIFRAAFLVAFFATSLVFGQRKDSISKKEIAEVILFKRDLKDVIPAQTLTGEDLQRLSSVSVADALRYFSGVQIKDYGGIGGLKTINVRSLGSQHVGVFYDGIQLGNAQNGLVDLGRYSLDDIEAISLYNGQKSEIFQPAKDFASASAIYLQSKTPSFAGDKKTNLSIRLKNSTIQLFNPSFRLEQKLSDKVAMSFSSEYLESDGVYKFRYFKRYPDGAIAYDTIAKRQDSDIKARRFETTLNGAIRNGTWNIRGYAYNSNRGIPAAIVNGRFGARGSRMTDDNYFVQATFRKKLFPKFETQLKAKFAYDYTYYADTVRTEYVIRSENSYIQREVYLSSSNLYTITPNWDISLNADFQFNNLDANLVNFSYPTRYTNLVALASTYQWNRLRFMGSLLGTFVHENVEKNAKSPDRREWTPALYAAYQPFNTKDLTLRAFYKRIFRMPTFNDLYYTNIGNTYLKPEYTTQYDVGFTYHKNFRNDFFQEFYLKADAYYNEVLDKIVAAPNGSMFRWLMMNLGRVEIRGVDVNLQSTIKIGNVKLKPLLSYTYQKAQDVSDPEDTFYKNQIPYTPWHSGTFTMMADYKDWSFNYSAIYVGERYDVNQDNIKYNYVQPWYTHDLSVQKIFRWKQQQFKASLELNNIFNQYYDVVINFPMPGRSLRLILNYTL